MKFEAILEFSTRFDVKKMCEVLGVNRSSYYRWLKRQEQREERNLKERHDVELIEKVFLDSDMIFGYRNITRELKAQGVEISEYRVRRLMKENGFYPEKKNSILKEKGITGSMSRPGCPYDNACVESFFASLKKEKIYRRRYETMEEVRKDVFWYIEMFYNRKRRHSALEYMTPVEYRLKYEENKVA